MTKHYLMSPELFTNLSFISKFNKLNGETYQEHICIRFEKLLSDDEQYKIKQFKQIKETLEYLKSILNFHHEYIGTLPTHETNSKNHKKYENN